jgi:hypothetical protein
MSSAVRAPSQVPAFKRYIVENNDGHMATNEDLDATVEIYANQILLDMGKTIVSGGHIYRKVAKADNTAVTGYICLDSDRIVGQNQGVSRLN